MEDKIRLQKAMSQSGLCSRRKAEEMISAGRVKVDGRVAKIGMKVNAYKQIILVDNVPLKTTAGKKMIYLALHKPRGYVTSMNDQFDRKDITDLTKKIKDRLFPIGRLDMDSEGLLLLTNDGEFANKLAHPKYEMEKTYRVTTVGNVDTKDLYNLAQGVEVDGRDTLPAYVEIVTEEKARTVLNITIREGRNRQIRKMFEAVNLPVKRLKRIEIENIKLGMIKSGEYRDLTDDEVNFLLNKADSNYEKNSSLEE